MEYDKINNLLGSESENLSTFVTIEYVRVNSLSNTYNEDKSIRFKTSMLRSDLCDYTVTGNHPRDRQNRPLILKFNAPFISFITRINGELIEDADDLDIVMPMYNLLEYSKNYRKTIGSLYNYYRDELSDDNDNDNFGNIKVVNSKAFKYKNKIIGNTYNVNSTIAPAAGGARDANPNHDANNPGKKSIELVIPLKYLANIWRALNIPLISCEVSLELKWNKNCVITSIKREINLDGGNTEASTDATLAINDCKLYIPVVTLSKDDEIKLLTNLKSGFIDLSKQQVLQENEDLIQQINFIGRLTEAANVFIIIGKKERTILEFSQNFANVLYK